MRQKNQIQYIHVQYACHKSCKRLLNNTYKCTVYAMSRCTISNKNAIHAMQLHRHTCTRRDMKAQH